jgi:hypothetical protein
MGYVGVSVMVIGGLGLIISTRGQRDWNNWTRRQKAGASLSAVIILAGLILMGIDSGSGT